MEDDFSQVNRELAGLLRELADGYEAKHDKFRERAYRGAALRIANYDKPIYSGDQVKKDIKGIGKSIAAKIDEFLETRDIGLTQTLSQEVQDYEPSEFERVVKLFRGIYGVGKKKAEEWFVDGHRTLADLSDVTMTRTQEIGYIYYHHINDRIDRDEIEAIDKFIGYVCRHDYDRKYRVRHMICGSYRRGSATSGDIDCLITCKGSEFFSMRQFINLLQEYEFVTETLVEGGCKFMGLCQLGPEYPMRRIDILLVTETEWPYASLYFTGGKGLNVYMRTRALDKKWILNEHGLFDDGGCLIKCDTEADIFEKLDMTYIDPHDRND